MTDRPTPPPDTALNRRAFARRVIRQSATLTHANEDVVVRTWDINRDGMCLLTPKPVPPGRRCMLTFVLPLGDGERTIAAPVKVIYSSYIGPASFKIGALFDGLDAETAGVIARFTADA